MVPAVAGTEFTTIGKPAEGVPDPQEFTPVTERLPDVATAEKLPVMDAVLPEAVKPAPE
jgi:hypothetical protein